MGLDLLLYDEKENLIKILEMPYDLHYHIFNETEVWGSYLVLRKIRDYYKSNVTLDSEDISKFKRDLNQISLFLNSEFKELTFQLTSELTTHQPWKIRITGD